jgi:hypothetical protein
VETARRERRRRRTGMGGNGDGEQEAIFVAEQQEQSNVGCGNVAFIRAAQRGRVDVEIVYAVEVNARVQMCIEMHPLLVSTRLCN